MLTNIAIGMRCAQRVEHNKFREQPHNFRAHAIDILRGHIASAPYVPASSGRERSP